MEDLSMRRIAVLFVSIGMLFATCDALAQTAGTGAITGLISDPSGAAIAGAAVEVTNGYEVHANSPVGQPRKLSSQLIVARKLHRYRVGFWISQKSVDEHRRCRH